MAFFSSHRFPLLHSPTMRGKEKSKARRDEQESEHKDKGEGECNNDEGESRKKMMCKVCKKVDQCQSCVNCNRVRCTEHLYETICCKGLKCNKCYSLLGLFTSGKVCNSCRSEWIRMVPSLASALGIEIRDLRALSNSQILSPQRISQAQQSISLLLQEHKKAISIQTDLITEARESDEDERTGGRKRKREGESISTSSSHSKRRKRKHSPSREPKEKEATRRRGKGASRSRIRSSSRRRRSPSWRDARRSRERSRR